MLLPVLLSRVGLGNGGWDRSKEVSNSTATLTVLPHHLLTRVGSVSTSIQQTCSALMLADPKGSTGMKSSLELPHHCT